MSARNSNAFKIERLGSQTIFIPPKDEEATAFVNKCIDKHNIDYGAYNKEIQDSEIKIGLEFEFYLKDETQMSDIIASLATFGKPIMYCPEDYNIANKRLDVWTIEKDRTLAAPEKRGFEVVSPKIDLKEAPLYIKTALNMIKEFGLTNNDCGLHFHISSEKESMKDIQPSKFMLFLDNSRTLEQWKYRTELNKEMMDIFKKTKLEDFDKNFKNTSRMYSLVSRSRYELSNHLEIRAIGGEDYQFKTNDILRDFKETVNAYYIACNPQVEKSKHKMLIDDFKRNHKVGRAITFDDLIEHINKTQDFNSLNLFEREMELENAIYHFEDKKESIVPIKTLLKEIVNHIKIEDEKEQKIYDELVSEYIKD